ncbi:DeoR family transcriptional regulator [Oceanicola sp. 22II-s10i]|uniref:phosphonoacetaldehyde dehydrogenase n=1 Tax=Oceanicola sp. 22II-s10i TaxID=1317116 RepID=UPI000B52577C|nr:phosphonoacetaldehyde dehydrogenase [Oceanicola sp. 22II-s10i]OWU85018.1 DeoR family transcriptional regulator [Oceanicola sp. 22II-s10i]
MRDVGHIRHEAMRIAGRKVSADAAIEVRNPWDDSLVGTVPAATAEQVREAFAIAGAYEAKLTRHERQKILLRTAELLAARREALSELITLELGVSRADARYEVGRAVDVFTLTGQLCLLDDGEAFACDISPNGKQRRIFTLREPLTAISAITPFNHPLNMVAHKIAPAIATNNCTVVKPTELTPLTAIALADVLYEAGLPPEMLSVVTGWPGDIGDEMILNPNADLVTFTGGVPVGKLIAAKAAYKRCVLELGGNDPLIVLKDLSDDDLAVAADLAVTGATKNSGQRCTAVKRILVQDSVADRFVPMVLERARALRFGDPMDEATQLGCVVNAASAELFDRRVTMAAEDGADVLYHPGRRGALLPPIVVDNVRPDSELVREETFGPVIPVIRVPDDDEAVMAISNGTAFGLSSGVCTHDYRRMQHYIRGLKVGTVNIWEVPGYRTEMSPFGGIKDSGNGEKEGVVEAMKSYTNLKTFSLPWEG